MGGTNQFLRLISIAKFWLQLESIVDRLDNIESVQSKLVMKTSQPEQIKGSSNAKQAKGAVVHSSPKETDFTTNYQNLAGNVPPPSRRREEASMGSRRD